MSETCRELVREAWVNMMQVREFVSRHCEGSGKNRCLKKLTEAVRALDSAEALMRGMVLRGEDA